MTIVATPGAADANSYVTLVEANAYFTARANASWTGTDAAKEAALIRGTAYLDNAYRTKWVGRRALEVQSLAWPRVDGDRGFSGPLYDIDDFPLPTDDVPSQVKHAAIEAALLALTDEALEPVLERGGAIKSIGKSVGPLRKDITYVDGASTLTRFVAVEGWLRGLVTGSPGSSSGRLEMVRA